MAVLLNERQVAQLVDSRAWLHGFQAQHIHFLTVQHWLLFNLYAPLISCVKRSEAMFVCRAVMRLDDLWILRSGVWWVLPASLVCVTTPISSRKFHFTISGVALRETSTVPSLWKDSAWTLWSWFANCVCGRWKGKGRSSSSTVLCQR